MITENQARNGSDMSTPKVTLLSVDDLADRWQQTKPTVYAMRYRREGPPGIRIGRTPRFRLADVEAWEEARREELVG